MESILILGGTNFIGRNLVESLTASKKYELTLLNRGTTNPNIFPNTKKIYGDRNNKEIGNLIKEDWDYVIDLSCYYPLSLLNILESISTSVKKYIFISTCSVYLNEEKTLRDESASVKKYEVEDFKDVTNETYGKRKSKCEEILMASSLNYTILRPSLVFGKYDNTDRFYYWLYQVKKYREILIPNQGKQKISITYIDDLINIINESIKPNQDRNTFNIVSYPEISISEIIKITSELLKKSPTQVNVSSNYLKDKNIKPWFDLPLWIDSDFFTFSNKKLLKAYKTKMTLLEKSISATVKYYENTNWPTPQYGISRDKQIELIKSNR